MELVHFVKDEEAQLAKKMEEKLLKLPKESGVLFVGVGVEAGTERSPTIYRVWVGCDRRVDPRTVVALVDVTLYEEIKEGRVVRTEARMGKVRD